MIPIQCQDLTRSYSDGERQHQAFPPTTIALASGHLVCIDGPSGSGKSTLLSIFGTIDTDYQGSLKIFGQELKNLSNPQLAKLRREDISISFQDPHLFAHLSVDENLLLSHQLKKPRRPPSSLEHWLQVFQLDDIRHRLPKTLSGGERHRVSLIRAFMSDAQLYIFDEPTNSLDKQRTSIVLEQLCKLIELNKLVVVASHDHRVKEIASRLITFGDNATCG